MGQITDLDELIEGFHLYCLAERKAPKTIGWYIPKLVYLKQFLEENSLATDATRITVTHLRTFIVHLQTDVRVGQNNPYRPLTDKPLSPRTLAGYARVLKLFFNWVQREGTSSTIRPSSSGCPGDPPRSWRPSLATRSSGC